jgi:ankyrin repeat protein
MIFSRNLKWRWDWYPEQTSPLHIAAVLGLGELARLLLEQHSSCVNEQDSHLLTPLLRAIEMGHEAVVEAFLDHGVDIDCGDKTIDGKGNIESALNRAAWLREDRIVRLLLERNMAKRGQQRKEEQELFVAAIVGDIDAIKKVICMGVNVDVTDIDGGTALQWASWYGHVHVVLCLLAAGSDIEARDKNGRQALHEAAERGHGDVVLALLRNGADIHSGDIFGYTALHRAAFPETPEMAGILLDHGADLKIVNVCNETALHIAVRMGRVETVARLLESGIDVRDFGTLEVRESVRVTPQQRHQIEQVIYRARRLHASTETKIVCATSQRISDGGRVESVHHNGMKESELKKG